MGNRYWGMIASSEAWKLPPWDRVVVDDTTIRLEPLGGTARLIAREELDAVEFERQWMPPLAMWTVVRLRFDDGTYAPVVFVPVWSRWLRSELERLEWPVRSIPFASSEWRTERES